MKSKNLNTSFLIAFFFGSVIQGFAQDEDPGFGFEGDPAAPIENWIIPLAIIGFVIAFRKLKKSKHVHN
jgi:hypothetical protein